MGKLQEVKNRFSEDLFATKAAGIEIEEAEKGYALCSMKIKAIHKNANNQVMGGAIFTLADFAFAVAANTDSPITVTQNSRIDFLGEVKGSILFGEAKTIKNGKKICLFEVNIKDDLENLIARVTSAGFVL